MSRVVVVGAGFAGLQVAKGLGSVPGLSVTLFDERNYHLFQPLLYQVATAGLSPAEIAAPIRSILSRHGNVVVLNERVDTVDTQRQCVVTESREQPYDWLVIACGARHSYFGRDAWEEHAPGLKTIAQAVEIRRRVLCAFERAEREEDPGRRLAQLTFVVVGGGPTGVELAGAIGEMSRFTLARDFRRIDPTHARILLIEAGRRILPSFSEALAADAARALESLGVQVLTGEAVTDVDASSVRVAGESIPAATTLWAAGVAASPLGRSLGAPLDRQGRVEVEPDLSVPGAPNVFVAGDQAHVRDAAGSPLPGVAPVAIQQGRYLAARIRAEHVGQTRPGPFEYADKGHLATIGRRRAVLQMGRFELRGFPAWLLWLVVHVYYLVGFKNRVFVVLQWAWAYLTFRRGARLIVDPQWRDHADESKDP